MSITNMNITRFRLPTSVIIAIIAVIAPLTIYALVEDNRTTITVTVTEAKSPHDYDSCVGEPLNYVNSVPGHVEDYIIDYSKGYVVWSEATCAVQFPSSDVADIFPPRYTEEYQICMSKANLEYNQINIHSEYHLIPEYKENLNRDIENCAKLA